MTRRGRSARPSWSSRAIAACGETGAAIPALQVTDTIKRVDAGGHVAGTRRPRARCAPCRRRRPSRFRPCSRRIAAPPRKAATISPTTPRWPNGRASRSRHFEGESGNVKLTTDEDFAKRRGAADRQPGRPAYRQRLRRARLRRRRSCLARRRQDSARPRADRPFRCRRRAACAGRRDPRRARRRRHRRAFPAQRSAMARRVVRPLPDIRGRARDQARRPDRASRCHHRLRGAAHRAAPRRDARAHRRDRRHVDRARGGEGDHQRAARLHRPQGRHRRHGDRHGPPALVLVRWSDAEIASRRNCLARSVQGAGSSWWRRRNPAPAGWSPAR